MSRSPFPTPLHHIAYLVDDLDRAIGETAASLGAGPFFVLRDIPLTATSVGEPVEFAHSAAFGQWGSLPVELMQIHHCDDERVAAAMGNRTHALHHLAWVVPSLEATSETLTRTGLPEFLHAGMGDFEFAYHDARRLYGHNIEVHADSEGFRAFFRQVLDASLNWDGQDPIRELSA